jgi:hypothetical protein
VLIHRLIFTITSFIKQSAFLTDKLEGMDWAFGSGSV